MTLNSFRRLLKSRDFKAMVVKFQHLNYVLWQSPTNHYLVVERPGVCKDSAGFSMYRPGRGQNGRPFYFFYQKWDSSKLRGYGDTEYWEEFDSALDPEPVILRRLTVLGVRPNINGIQL